MARSQFHPTQRRKALCRELLLNEVSHRTVNRSHGLRAALEDEWQAHCFHLRDEPGNEGDADPRCEDGSGTDGVDIFLGAPELHA